MDISTIFAVQGGLLLVSTIAIYINWRMNRSLPEARYWLLSHVSAIIAAFLLSVFLVPPELATLHMRMFVILGNVTYALGFIFIFLGICCLVNRPAPRWRTVVLGLLFIGLAQLAGDLAPADGHIWRAAISTTALTLINAASTWVLLFSGGRVPPIYRVLASLTAITVVVMGWRSTLLILNGLGGDHALLWVGTIPFFASTLLVSAFTICFILVTVRTLHVRLIKFATTDPLTGILNRRAFGEVATLMVANAKRNADVIAIAMVDLDLFKRVNDKYGHAVGDDVLKHFVDVTQKTLRSGDVFARYGGEEFALLLLGNDRENTVAVAERVRNTFARSSIKVQNKMVHTTASIGVSFMSEDECDLDGVIDRADKALYEAKSDGRNKVVVDDTVTAAT